MRRRKRRPPRFPFAVTSRPKSRDLFLCPFKRLGVPPLLPGAGTLYPLTRLIEPYCFRNLVPFQGAGHGGLGQEASFQEWGYGKINIPRHSRGFHNIQQPPAMKRGVGFYIIGRNGLSSQWLRQISKIYSLVSKASRMDLSSLVQFSNHTITVFPCCSTRGLTRLNSAKSPRKRARSFKKLSSLISGKSNG